MVRSVSRSANAVKRLSKSIENSGANRLVYSSIQRQESVSKIVQELRGQGIKLTHKSLAQHIAVHYAERTVTTYANTQSRNRVLGRISKFGGLVNSLGYEEVLVKVKGVTIDGELKTYSRWITPTVDLDIADLTDSLYDDFAQEQFDTKALSHISSVEIERGV